ncbi:MAG TPA: hypothetical protein VKD72_39170 [Gemmataceae bacterium]|nr:hypothetical protein [Gemmataceae bacterium]
MGLFRSLSLIALRQVTAGAAQAAGLAGAEGVAGFLTDRFTDHPGPIPQRASTQGRSTGAALLILVPLSLPTVSLL